MTQDSYCFNLLADYAKDSRVKLVDATVFSKYVLTDLSLQSEDQNYALVPEFRDTLRRGNTFVQVLATKHEPDYFFIGRRGLPKFFDLRLEYLLFNMMEIKKLPFEDKQYRQHEQMMQVIFRPAAEAIKRKHVLRVFALEKVNGQNVQISWCKLLQKWLVCSKNVSMLVGKEDEMAHSQYSGKRYKYASQFALEWFTVVQSIRECQGVEAVKELKQNLSEHTLVGQYVGHPDFQHLVRYNKTQIVWYAVVSNTRKKQFCMPVQEAQQLFKTFGLPAARVVFQSQLSSWRQLNSELLSQFKKIAKGHLEQYNEGVVIYVQQAKSQGQQVISICKLKNLQYRLFRKIRQKLSNFNRKFEAQVKKDGQIDTVIKQIEAAFLKESEQLCQSHDASPPFALSSYQRVLSQLLKYLSRRQLDEQYLRSHFIDLLDIAHYTLALEKPLKSKYLKDEELSQKLRAVQWSEYRGLEQKFIIAVPMFIPGTGGSSLGKILAGNRKFAWTNLSYEDVHVELAQKKMQEVKKMTWQIAVETTGELARKKLIDRLRQLVQSGVGEGRLRRFVYFNEGAGPEDLKQLKNTLKDLDIPNYQVHLVLPKCYRFFGQNKYAFSFSYILLGVLNVITQEYAKKHRAIAYKDVVKRARQVFERVLQYEDFEERREKLPGGGKVHYVHLCYEQEGKEELQGQAVEILSKLKSGEKDKQVNRLVQSFIESASQSCKLPDLRLQGKQLQEEAQGLVSSLADPTFKKAVKGKKISFNVQSSEVKYVKDLDSVLYLGVRLDSKQIFGLIDSLPRGLLKYTKDQPSFHVTALFCGNKSVGQLEEHPVLRQFKPDKSQTIEVDWVVAVLDCLVLAVVASQIQCENQTPHVTLALNRGFKPADSNVVLKQLQDLKWSHDKQVDVQLRGKLRRAVLWQLSKTVALDGKWEIVYKKE